MSLSKYESEVKIIERPVEQVYMLYSDLSHFERLKEGLSNPEINAGLQEKFKENNVTEEQLADLKDKVKDISFTTDSLTATTSMGVITLNIVEREAPKLIKLESVGAPIQLYLWVQLLPHTMTSCKLKVTVGAEVNMFMKPMVSKPLKKAAEGLAQMLSGIPPM